MSEPNQLADYDLLLQKLNEGMGALASDVTIQYQESVRISEEIEALRAITEQVNAQTDTLQLVTVG
jgi:division protein CdvB (Snf7/Vps24/ESCRT-III family)